MRAACCLNGNFGKTVGAAFGRGLCHNRRWFAFEFVDHFDHHEYSKSHDQKADDGIDK